MCKIIDLRTRSGTRQALGQGSQSQYVRSPRRLSYALWVCIYRIVNWIRVCRLYCLLRDDSPRQYDHGDEFETSVGQTTVNLVLESYYEGGVRIVVARVTVEVSVVNAGRSA